MRNFCSNKGVRGRGYQKRLAEVGDRSRGRADSAKGGWGVSHFAKRLSSEVVGVLGSRGSSFLPRIFSFDFPINTSKKNLSLQGIHVPSRKEAFLGDRRETDEKEERQGS